MILEQERITSIDLIELESHYPRTVGRNAKLGSHGAGGKEFAVTVRCESGASGWGLLAWDPGARLDARQLADTVDPKTGEMKDEAVAELWAAVHREAGLLVASAQALVGRRLGDLFDPHVGVIDDAALTLDFALHDLAGQILATPVYELLGAKGERSILCYDGAIYFDDLDPADDPRGIDAVLRNCAADYALGYRAFKLKIGRGHRWMDRAAGLARDIAVTRAVRADYPGCRILVDANNGYSRRTFLDYLNAVVDCELFWIEEPFLEDETDLSVLRERLERLGARALVADGEGDEANEGKLLDLARKGLVDVALFDVVTYGLTAWRRLMPQIEELGIGASPHAWGSPLKTLYAGQIAAGLGNVVAIEGVPGRTDSVDASAYVLRESVLRVPDLPGFGIALTTG